MELKPLGIVRNMDDLGRITIPMELRRTYGIREGDPMEFFSGDGGAVVVKKYVADSSCMECGVKEGEMKGSNVRLCMECWQKM